MIKKVTLNEQLRVDTDFINDYVENAQNDIKRIREKAEDAVEKAKQNLIYTY